MNALLRFRQDHGLSQQELSVLLGLSRNFLAQIESDRRKLPPRLLPLFRSLRDLATDIQDQEPDLSQPLPDPKAAMHLGREIRALQNQLAGLRYQQGELAEKISRCKRGLLLVQRLSPLPDWLPASPLLTLTLGAIEDFALVELNERGPYLHQWMELQARHLEEKIAFLLQMQADKETGRLKH